MGYSPWGRKELDRTERLSQDHLSGWGRNLFSEIALSSEAKEFLGTFSDFLSNTSRAV